MLDDFFGVDADVGIASPHVCKNTVHKLDLCIRSEIFHLSLSSGSPFSPQDA